ncbi:MAG: TIGR01777 family oxidoreductase [Sandaracinaceae bacterium]
MSADSTFEARTEVRASADEVFAFHERPGAFERLTPPYEPVRVLRREGTIRDGDRAVLRLQVGPFHRDWVAEHRDYEAGRQFRDVQRSGPFAAGEHLHRVEPAGPDRSTMIDRVDYRLPLGALGRLLGGAMVRGRLRRMFAYRHDVLRHDLRLHHLARGRSLKVAISGASGLVGSTLTALLESGGHEVIPLVRGADRAGIRWDPSAGTIDREALEGLDAVVHLAGENIAQRWTDEARRRIRASREEGTGLVAEALAGLKRPPSVLVSASAVGIYGDRRGEPLDEAAELGTGFLADVCRAWEAAAAPAAEAGIRVVNARLGVVLSPRGGALAKMLPAFRFGLGGPVGRGEQPMSWIGLDDAVGALYFAVLDERLEGPVNVTAPRPLPFRTFASTLGAVLGRPAFLPLPAFAVKLLFGRMGEETLLAGAPVVPGQLEAAAYPFAHPGLEEALRHQLGRPEPSPSRP